MMVSSMFGSTGDWRMENLEGKRRQKKQKQTGWKNDRPRKQTDIWEESLSGNNPKAFWRSYTAPQRQPCPWPLKATGWGPEFEEEDSKSAVSTAIASSHEKNMPIENVAEIHTSNTEASTQAQTARSTGPSQPFKEDDEKINEKLKKFKMISTGVWRPKALEERRAYQGKMISTGVWRPKALEERRAYQGKQKSEGKQKQFRGWRNDKPRRPTDVWEESLSGNNPKAFWRSYNALQQQPWPVKPSGWGSEFEEEDSRSAASVSANAVASDENVENTGRYRRQTEAST